ncbi:hypothetical protein BOTBODRAFT_149665 [Botryobasidium botryosum FD-172 SS1]|uniref:Ricin B lectin domain-containing protein n=1 Tax=Botryobasidium botryosum (strain FD-172 SS1) TaxID=930990 RepID=A0A067M3N3_BOTB1|nr:hypothetical protein BOTBODRAFT_149665 [Botryobasidium botryosum FD-172 SS1]
MTLQPAFPEGRFRLRAVTTSDPNPGVGGVFATGSDPSEPVTTAPDSPRFADRQTWHIVKNKDENTYKIHYAGQTPHPKEGFTYASLDSGTPITLGAPKDFTFELWPGTDVYVIRPVGAPPGPETVVGVRDVDSTGTLVIERIFPGTPTSPKLDLPAWKLYPA